MKAKSLTLAYFLFVIFGFQGVHQFYLGNWRRGLLILVSIHASTFWFAYLEQQSRTLGQEMPLVPVLVIFVGLLVGLGVWVMDLFTLRRQLREPNPKPPL